MEKVNVYDWDKTIFPVDSTVAFVRWCLRWHPGVIWPLRTPAAMPCTISSVVKSIVCVNRHVHRHDSNIITEEQLRNYDCPIQLISHGKVPHTVLASHPHDCCPHTRTEE
mgnify:CR=1 FL=1